MQTAICGKPMPKSNVTRDSLSYYSNHLPNGFRQKRKRTHRAKNRIKLKLLALVPAIAQGLFNGGGANYVRISLSPY